MRKFMPFMLILLLITLSACGRRNNGVEEEAPFAPVDMTQMPFIIEDAPGFTVIPLGWQASLEIPVDGFTLIPQKLGETGVCVTGDFVLSIPDGAAGMWSSLTIDGLPSPLVSGQLDGSYLVTPAAPLSHNRLYTFRLTTAHAGEITWVFQTAPAFALVSTFPAHQSVNVPVNTGIELHFSTAGYSDVRPYFSIFPPVEGRFIQRGAATIFMPTNPLAYGQVYTVTLAAGVGLEGIAGELTSDIVFAFETSDTTHHTWPDESFHFSSMYTELPSFEPPAIHFRINYPHMGTRPRVDIEVFRFGDEENAVQTIQQFFDTPRWAWFAWHNNQINTAGLERVARMHFTESQNFDDWHWQETFHLPDALPPGFYIVNASIGGELSDQMLLQITDLAVQIFADDYQTLVWVHDMTTGHPVQGAAVRDKIRTGQTDANGIVSLPGGITNSEDHFIIEAPDGKRLVIFHARHVQPNFFFSHRWWGSPQPSELYWTALQLDRTLFQRSDTLYFWGFIQNRTTREEIDYLTAVISEGWGWNWGGGGHGTLHRQTVPVQGGSYNGGIVLPHLDPGWYVLTVYHGDISVGVIHFTVQDFVKPPYDLQITADRRAIFMDEQVTFTARTAFFEGTPVPDLQLSYNVWGWPVTLNQHHRSATTDEDGEVEVTLGPFTARADAQGQGSITLGAEATLPEIGPTFRQHSVQVFVNDINVNVRATREGADATLSIEAHHITLDRLNDGSAKHSGDFLCRPLVRQDLDVEIVRVYWVATRIGERYCFINRVVVPRYRYDRREEVIERFSLRTDAEGEASRDFTVPNRDGESYLARVRTTDGNGRQIMHEVFIGRDWWRFFSNAQSGEPFLDGGREWNEGYDIGEEVRLTIMSGTEKLEQGNFLFIIASNGIIEYRIGENPLVFTFNEEHLPNAGVYAVHFNGHTYHSGWNMRETLRFNHASRQLTLDIETCKEYYRPGETASLTLRVTDPQGRPVQAHVNLAVVDEALFALADYTPNTLMELYRNISSGVRHQLATHRTFRSAGHDDVMFGGRAMALGAAGMAFDDAGAPVPTAAPAAESAESAAVDGGGGTHIREIFEDTALFFSARTDAQGMATVTFRLPDNITSWRLTASGITDNLYAGTDTSNLIVTNPLFVHYSLNNIFLVGDVPVLGVNAFGTALTSGQQVTFKVWSDDGNDYDDFDDYANSIILVEGYAFARVNIPLWEMTAEGSYSIFISVTCENGLTDIVRHNFDVIGSHRLIDTAVFYEVTPQTQFAPGGPGLTQITFTDLGQGQFLNALLSMRHPRGARVEELVMRREANRLITAYFADMHLFMTPCAFNPLDYQQANGGIAMLPHAEGELSVTVRMMPFIMDEINRHALRNFLNTAMEDPSQNTVQALYGLALLREPVLLYLHAFAQAENLSLTDTMYLALAFAALGDIHNARMLYSGRILPYIIPIAPFYRVEADTRFETMRLTSLAALLAAQLEMPQRTGLHNYTVRNHTNDLIVRMNQLAFIVHEIQQVNDQPASITFTLFGEEITRDLSGWHSFTLRIPTQNLHEFEITAITGEVGAISTHRIPLEEIETTDADVTITRQFFRAGETTPRTTFNQGDLVRVQITVDYSRTALTGSYMITDFLPAGLVYTPGSARSAGSSTGRRADTPGRHVWATAEGQRVQFFDFYNPHHRRTHDGVFYYYARVINPGTFRAEGVVIQNIDAPGYMTVGEDTVITIID